MHESLSLSRFDRFADVFLIAAETNPQKEQAVQSGHRFAHPGELLERDRHFVMIAKATEE